MPGQHDHSLLVRTWPAQAGFAAAAPSRGFNRWAASEQWITLTHPGASVKRKHPRPSPATPPTADAARPARSPRAPRALRELRARKPVPEDISPLDVDVLLAEAESGGPPDLTDARVVRRILRHHGLRPNKSF